MSKTVIVEGDLIKRSQGKMELWATEGNYDFTAATENIWTSGDGVNENDYSSPEEKEEEEKEGVKLTNVLVNLFFDGTQNNKTNTDAKAGRLGKDGTDAYNDESNKEDDSYTNDYSNVARGYDATDKSDPNQINIYIEGIGTRDLDSDELTVVGLGDSLIGSSGIKDKVKKSCKLVAKEIRKKFKEVDTITINVFGFSRGAAAARHFLHVANSPINITVYSDPKKTKSWYYLPEENNPVTIPYSGKSSLHLKNGYLGASLSKEKLKFKKVFFNFAGLYDTVSSYGVYHGNDVNQLGLNAVKNAYMTFQISADDEYRENFDLTNIKSSGIHGLELTFPGVHSDIGGSYSDRSEEVTAVFKETIIAIDEPIRTKKFKQILIDEGWYNDKELTIKRKITGGKADYITYHLVGTRTLRNTYDRIPLLQMINFSKDENYSEMKYDGKLLIDINKVVNSDSLLKRINSQLDSYKNKVVALRNDYVHKYNAEKNSGNKKSIETDFLHAKNNISYLDYVIEEDLKHLRHEYLHTSAKVDKFGLGPRITQAVESKKRKREIHNG